MFKLLLRNHRKSTAQAMVEFSLALPILLLVMYGLIETGRLVFLYASVVTAARQAVRYGSATGLNPAGTPYYNDCTGIRNAAKSLGFIQPFSDSNIQIHYDNGPDAAHSWTQATCPIIDTNNPPAHPANGDRIYVRVSTQYAPIVPLVPFRPFTIASAGWRTLVVSIPVQVDVPAVSLPPGTTGALSIVKDAWCASCTPPGSYYESPGQIITYTYRITNPGTDAVVIVPTNGHNVDDSRLGEVCPTFPNPLPPLTTVTCTVNYTIQTTDMPPVLAITNVVSMQGISNSIPVAAQTSKTINFVPRPKLTLVKTGDVRSTVAKGLPVDYDYALTNSGNVDLTVPFTIHDTNLSAAATCPAGPLTVGSTIHCTGTHYLTSNDINYRYVDNTAYATALYNGYTVTSNTVTLRVLVPGLLLVVSSCNANPPCGNGIPLPVATVTGLNQTVYYTYYLTNRLSSWMYSGKVTDNRGAANFTCSSWNLIAPGTTASCSRSYNAYTQADMDNPLGQFLNTANASASSGKPSNTATAAVNVTQTPSFTLTKTASVSKALTLGASITYTYKFTNTGNVTLGPPYSVTDDKIPPQGTCSAMTGSLAVGGGTLTCTRTYTVTQADLDAGSIINHATATATFTASAGPQTINSTAPAATATVWTYDGPRFAVIKTANPVTYDAFGQTITYSYALKNTGSWTIGPPYAVTDQSLGAVDCSGVGTLAQGASAACNTLTYSIQDLDLTNGTVTNHVTATALATDPTNPSNTQTITVVPNPTTLIINRFVCSSTYLNHTNPTPIPSGSDLIWTIVNNTGLPVHISSITISWSSGPPYLNNLFLNGTNIWTGLSASSGGFTVPGGPWLLPSGNTPLRIQFTTGTAYSVHVVLNFQETGCPVVDSNNATPG